MEGLALVGPVDEQRRALGDEVGDRGVAGVVLRAERLDLDLGAAVGAAVERAEADLAVRAGGDLVGGQVDDERPDLRGAARAFPPV